MGTDASVPVLLIPPSFGTSLYNNVTQGRDKWVRKLFRFFLSCQEREREKSVCTIAGHCEGPVNEVIRMHASKDSRAKKSKEKGIFLHSQQTFESFWSKWKSRCFVIWL